MTYVAAVIAGVVLFFLGMAFNEWIHDSELKAAYA